MKSSNRDIESRFIDYVEGTLSAADREKFEQALSSDASLKASFESYRKVVALSAQVRSEQYQILPSFSAQVLERIESVGFFRRYFMKIVSFDRKIVYGALATCATVLLAVQIGRENPEWKLSPSVAKSVPYAGNASVDHDQAQAGAKEGRGGPVVPKLIDRKDQVTTIFNDAEITKGRDKKSKTPAEALSAPRDLGGSRPNAIARSEEQFKDERVSEVVRKSAVGIVGQALSGDSSGRPSGALAPFEMPMPPIPQRYIEPWQSPTQDTETYRSYDENPRIEVATQPISTFSIDVDTGSYTNVRRFLSMGNLPPKDAVRIEEFINYFDYSYPVQYEKPFTLSYEIAPSPLEQDRYLLKLGIKARDAKVSEKPWNLVFLVDVSGSMNMPNKLPLVKQALALLAGKMRPQDRVAIVTYAGSAGVLLNSTAGSERQTIINAVQSLGAGGSTNGAGGIMAAYDIAQRAMIPGGVNRVVLATDGDFNVGIVNHDELIRLIEEKRRSGVTLTTLGFGDGNIQEGMMEQLANRGNGNYFYIDSFKEARKVLETDLAGTMEVVAKDVKLQIDFNPEQVSQYRLIGYENRKLRNQDFNNDQIDAGEIGSGHTVTALYEIVLAGSRLSSDDGSTSRYQKPLPQPSVSSNENRSAELAFLKIRYKEPDAGSSKLLEFPIQRSDLRSNVADTSADFRFAAAVSYFGHILRESSYRGSYTIEQLLVLAEGALGADTHGYRHEFVEMMRNYAALGR